MKSFFKTYDIFSTMRKIKGFTLVELLIVMSVVAILVAIIIPSFRGLQNEAWITKAEKEVMTLQTAIESYYRHHSTYPAQDTYVDALINASPKILTSTLEDPWKTDDTTDYGYKIGNLTGFGTYYIVWSWGIDGAKNWTLNETDKKIVVSGDDIVQSNLTIERQ